MSISEFQSYMKSHFYDHDRLNVLRRDFPDLLKEMIESEGPIPQTNFLHNPFTDIMNSNDTLKVIAFEFSIPPHIFAMMFPNCSYTFPWLEKEADGHIKNMEPHNAKYADYEFFDLSGIVCHDPHKTVRDPELEDCLKGVSNVEIDLRKEPTDGPLYKTNQCWIYPESIRGTPSYDVLYYADYLFKFFFRGMERIILRGKPIESVGTDDFLLSRVPAESDGLYHTMRASKCDAFVGLRNIIRLFALKNKARIDGWREAHAQYGRRTFIANLQFPNIEYGKDEEGIYIAPLKPNIQIQELDGSLPPENSPAFVFKEFFETNYEAIKKSFPIYARLERLYKIMVCNRILTGQMGDVEAEKNELVYIENHVDSIACHGGIKLQPKIWTPVVIPPRKFTPPHQISSTPNVVVNVRVARRPLEYAPVGVGSVAHSALILETREGRKMLLEYMGDSQVHMKDFQPDDYDWKIQEHGQALDKQMTPEEIRSIMESQVNSDKYNIHTHNCHLAQEITRRAIGLKVDQPYNPLW
jgi:hypothetical protein